VQLLEQHYPELERLARQRTSEMEPLRTDIFIERGAAPGAGFVDPPASAGTPRGRGTEREPAASTADPVLAGSPTL
jgi:hypothetical protein